MKKAVLLTLFVMLIPLSSQAGSSYYSCEKKLIKLEKEFRSAVSHGNKHKIYKIKKKIHKLGDKYYDSYSGATRGYDYYPRGKASELERELDSLRRVLEALNDLK